MSQLQRLIAAAAKKQHKDSKHVPEPEYDSSLERSFTGPGNFSIELKNETVQASIGKPPQFAAGKRAVTVKRAYYLGSRDVLYFSGRNFPFIASKFYFMNAVLPTLYRTEEKRELIENAVDLILSNCESEVVAGFEQTRIGLESHGLKDVFLPELSKINVVFDSPQAIRFFVIMVYVDKILLNGQAAFMSGLITVSESRKSTNYWMKHLRRLKSTIVELSAELTKLANEERKKSKSQEQIDAIDSAIAKAEEADALHVDDNDDETPKKKPRTKKKTAEKTSIIVTAQEETEAKEKAKTIAETEEVV